MWEGENMNLTAFLSSVGEGMEGLTEGELRQFVLSIARMIPEKDREVFLQLLSKEETGNADDAEDARLRHLMGVLSRVREGSAFFCLDRPEHADTTLQARMLMDPEHLQEVTEEAVCKVHELVDAGRYQEGYALALQLMDTPFQVRDTGGSEILETLTLEDLVMDRLIHADTGAMLLDGLKSAFLAFREGTREEKLFGYLTRSMCRHLSLKDLGEETNMADFLTGWIACLGRHPGRRAQQLLAEAIDLKGDTEHALEMAESYGTVHPGLYMVAIHQTASDSERLQIGRAALERIPEGLLMRSFIALSLASAAERLGDGKARAEALIEAYRSDTSPLNYVRIALLPEAPCTQQEMDGIYMEHRWHLLRAYRSEADEAAENGVDRYSFQLLRYLSGDASDILSMLETGEKWDTETYRNFCMLLFLWHRGERYGRGMKGLQADAEKALHFSPDVWNAGNGSAETGENLFLQVVHRFTSREGAKAPTTDEIRSAGELVKNQAKMDLDEKHRETEDRCAKLVAGMAEIMRAWGDALQAAAFTDSFHEMYARRGHFRERLRWHTDHE
ncbi:MAG: hypothetical protein IJ083_09100 [Clostridia bacterium]|nr:hypothetical protein [Clostridia bacterium]